MSQRRGGAPRETAAAQEEMIPFSEVLDPPSVGLTMNREEDAVPLEPIPQKKSSSQTAPLSLDGRYEAEAQNLKLKQWKEGPFAAGLTESTWEEEYARYKTSPGEACMDMNDAMPCMCCSALVCGYLGAARVGNMAVLKQSTEWVEEIEEDENGESKTTRFTRPRLDVVVGPVRYMLCRKFR
jgi:hypothetical protein